MARHTQLAVMVHNTRYSNGVQASKKVSCQGENE